MQAITSNKLRGLRNSLGYFCHVKHLTIDTDIDIDKLFHLVSVK